MAILCLLTIASVAYADTRNGMDLGQAGSSALRGTVPRARQPVCTYMRDDTRRADGAFAKGTDGCDGVGECQFITLLEAQTFCDNRVACVAVLKHSGRGNCAGGKGCYTPRSGELKVDNGHAGKWIKSCSVPPMPTPEPTMITAVPTTTPSREPTAVPARAPTASPTASPTKSPTVSPTSSPTSSPTVVPTAASTGVVYEFVLFDGADRACRGSNDKDNSPAYYNVMFVSSEDACKNQCRDAPACEGIEYYYSSGRCELWTHVIGSTHPAAGFSCLRYEPVNEFEPVGGGIDRVCRGSNLADTSPSYYTFFEGVLSLGACKERCILTNGCTGVEYPKGGNCEVSKDQIGASRKLQGFYCYRYKANNPFSPVDGGSNRACRGANPDDSEPSYYSFHRDIASLEACQNLCVASHSPPCKGIEYHSTSGNCEVWSQDIHSSKLVQGFSCYRYTAPR